MPELRLNLIAREWVLIAKEKGVKPEDFIESKDHADSAPEFSSTCPFCPGNERLTPEEIFRKGDDEKWHIRVVRNKFSNLSEQGEKVRWNYELKVGVNGVGTHEIIVDSPEHNLSTAAMSLEQLEAVIDVYKERLAQVYKDPKIEHAIIFKNSGHRSGTSLEHSITQISGIPITPIRVRDRVEFYMSFHFDTGTCLMCRTVQDELRDRMRVLCDTEHFVSFIPYAALSPFHIWIIPKRHSGFFPDISGEEIRDFAFNLKKTMSMLHYGLGSPDFNFVIASGRPSDGGSEYMHWYVSIIPRVSFVSGYEIGSGVFINPMLPEVSTQFLKSVSIPD